MLGGLEVKRFKQKSEIPNEFILNKLAIIVFLSVEGKCNIA